MATSSNRRPDRRRALLLWGLLLAAPLGGALAQSELPPRETQPTETRPAPTTPQPSLPKTTTPAPQSERTSTMPSTPSTGGGGSRTTPSDVLHNTERHGAPPMGGGGATGTPENSGGGDVSGQINDLGKSMHAQDAGKTPETKTPKKTVTKTDAKKRPPKKSTKVRTWEGVHVDIHGNMMMGDEEPGLPPPPAPKKGGGTTTGEGEGGGKTGGTAAESGGGKPKATTYVDDCRDKAVPIPPPWGDPGWEKQETLKPEQLWILNSEDLSAEVWTYRPKKGEPGEGGLCVALPRYQNGTLIAMGIICQGKEGYVCFWDLGAGTVDQPGGDPSQKANPKGVKVDDMPNGSNLLENCTDCHRGSNGFIGHAGIDTIGGESTKPYKPLSSGRKDQVWENPKAPATLAPKCQTCHILPKLTREYCEAVLKSALGSPTEEGKKVAMPPPDEDAAEYKGDIEQLRKACADLGVTF
ncbi:MAG TPA: hypothetical protein VMG55_02930 [Stellaceae bacterium]|nr:hypothetical protein [Stellaceae bacterium]